MWLVTGAARAYGFYLDIIVFVVTMLVAPVLIFVAFGRQIWKSIPLALVYLALAALASFGGYHASGEPAWPGWAVTLAGG